MESASVRCRLVDARCEIQRLVLQESRLGSDLVESGCLERAFADRRLHKLSHLFAYRWDWTCTGRMQLYPDNQAHTFTVDGG